MKWPIVPIKHELIALSSTSFGNKKISIKFHVPRQYEITAGAANNDENTTSRNTKNAACTVCGVDIVPCAKPAVLPRILSDTFSLFDFLF